MNESHDLLQDRLARLEAGEPLEAVLAGLPEDDANLVKLAAMLQALPHPERTAGLVQAQRQALLRAVKEGKPMSPESVGQTKVKPRWLWPAVFAGGAAAVFVCVLLVSALAGLIWLRQIPGVARDASPGPVSVYLPVAGMTQPANPQSGVLQEVRGIVEVQAPDGAWQAVKDGHQVTAGQRLRTRALSGATLAFYDGSQARLGPNTEISVDVLDAQIAGPRVVALTQWVGESDHEVAASSDAASRYEVATPSGVGAAKGTSFHVLVTSTLLVRFDVDEGEVAVTGLSVTVVVVAGQSTTIVAGQPPETPVFRVTGEGQVERTGATWRIAGHDFRTHANTVIVGNPQVGDWVAFEGRILADGTRVADRIILLHGATVNKFVFVGTVDAISDTVWTIAGRLVRVDEDSVIEPGLAVGDRVEVRGGIASDGTLWASSIRRFVANAFQFTGVVQSISPTVWVVSGISVTVNFSTTIEAGIEEGDIVRVAGQVLEDNTWLATSIQQIEIELGTFDFVGVVMSIDPWIVSGIPLSTTAQTEIDEEIEIGNRVRVTGQILADGTWLAQTITQLDEGERHHIQFVARVWSIDPWVVGGVELTVDDETQIVGDVEEGDLVLVEGNLLPDGTVVAKRITLLHHDLGCVDTSVVVRNVDAEQVVLLNWQTIPLDPEIEVEGDIAVASVVIVHICVGEDGALTVVSIIVIFQLDELPVLVRPSQELEDCKPGPGLGLGHCKHRHENGHDHDDD